MPRPPENSILVGPDGSCSPAGEKTINRSYKIFIRQHLLLEELPYQGNGAVLVRLLLDEFFAGRVPAAKMKFDRLYAAANKSKKGP